MTNEAFQHIGVAIFRQLDETTLMNSALVCGTWFRFLRKTLKFLVLSHSKRLYGDPPQMLMYSEWPKTIQKVVTHGASADFVILILGLKELISKRISLPDSDMFQCMTEFSNLLKMIVTEEPQGAFGQKYFFKRK